MIAHIAVFVERLKGLIREVLFLGNKNTTIGKRWKCNLGSGEINGLKNKMSACPITGNI